VKDALYVVGGQQRVNRGLIPDRKHWYEYAKGLLLRVEPATGTVETCLEYVSPPDTCASEDPQILFKSATIAGERLYASTQTEVMVLALPSLEQLAHVSLPCFNDVHHVRPTPDGTLLVANSGLDMALEIEEDGTVVREWSTLDGDEPWTRFSRDVDYRMGISTKPHASHPNYVFYVGDEPWATRFEQQDAISLVDRSRRIDIGLERIHDGYAHGDSIYFTTVDGKVAIASVDSLRVDEVIDLNDIHSEDVLLGWTRSILVDDGLTAWIGFSRIRATKIRENVGWVARGFKRVMPTHIARYDLARRELLQEIDLEPAGLSAVFSVLPDPHAGEEGVSEHLDADLAGA
jgi:hypothetical protein